MVTKEQKDTLIGEHICNMLLDYPHLIDNYTEEQLDKLEEAEIHHLLKIHPQLVDNFTREQINKMGWWSIDQLIHIHSDRHPGDNFAEKILNKMGGERMCRLLLEQPYLIDVSTKEQLDELIEPLGRILTQ